MNRRQFIREVFLWSAGTTLAIPRFTILPEALAAEKPPALLSVAKGEEYSALVQRVLAPLGGMGQFVRPGDRVVVKPNIGWDRNPEQGANTHPLVVTAVVAQALEAGAKKVLVFDRTCNEQRRCYANSGIEKAILELNDSRAVIEHIDQRKFVPDGHRQGQVAHPMGDLQGCPGLRLLHQRAGGQTPRPLPAHPGPQEQHGRDRRQPGFSAPDLGQSLADLATVIRPKLTIIDATRILLRNGPQGGDLKDVRKLDTLIASADPVAADAYATTLFDLPPDAIDSTVAAYKMGLGEMDLDRIKVLTA